MLQRPVYAYDVATGYLAVVMRGEEVRIWGLRGREAEWGEGDVRPEAVFRVRGGAIRGLAFVGGGELLIVQETGRVGLYGRGSWGEEGEDPRWEMMAPLAYVAQVSSWRGGQVVEQVAIGGAEGEVVLLDVSGEGAPEVVRASGGHGDKVEVLVFSKDGRRLATTSRDRKISIWSTAKDERVQGEDGERRLREVAELEGAGGWPLAMAFSTKGHKLATGCMDNGVYLWNLEAREPLEGLRFDHYGWVEDIAFNHEDTLLVSGSWDHHVGVYSVAPLMPRFQFQHHSDYVVKVLMVPGKDEVVAGSYDGTISVWDIGTGELRAELKGHGDWVTELAWVEEGLLASFSSDETIRLWSMEEYREVALLGDGAAANFTLGGGFDLASFGLEGSPSTGTQTPAVEPVVAQPRVRTFEKEDPLSSSGKHQTAMGILDEAEEKAAQVVKEPELTGVSGLAGLSGVADDIDDFSLLDEPARDELDESGGVEAELSDMVWDAMSEVEEEVEQPEALLDEELGEKAELGEKTGGEVKEELEEPAALLDEELDEVFEAPGLKEETVSLPVEVGSAGEAAEEASLAEPSMGEIFSDVDIMDPAFDPLSGPLESEGQVDEAEVSQAALGEESQGEAYDPRPIQPEDHVESLVPDVDDVEEMFSASLSGSFEPAGDGRAVEEERGGSDSFAGSAVALGDEFSVPGALEAVQEEEEAFSEPGEIKRAKEGFTNPGKLRALDERSASGLVGGPDDASESEELAGEKTEVLAHDLALFGEVQREQTTPMEEVGGAALNDSEASDSVWEAVESGGAIEGLEAREESEAAVENRGPGTMLEDGGEEAKEDEAEQKGGLFDRANAPSTVTRARPMPSDGASQLIKLPVKPEVMEEMPPSVPAAGVLFRPSSEVSLASQASEGEGGEGLEDKLSAEVEEEGREEAKTERLDPAKVKEGSLRSLALLVKKKRQSGRMEALKRGEGDGQEKEPTGGQVEEEVDPEVGNTTQNWGLSRADASRPEEEQAPREAGILKPVSGSRRKKGEVGDEGRLRRPESSVAEEDERPVDEHYGNSTQMWGRTPGTDAKRRKSQGLSDFRRREKTLGGRAGSESVQEQATSLLKMDVALKALNLGEDTALPEEETSDVLASLEEVRLSPGEVTEVGESAELAFEPFSPPVDGGRIGRPERKELTLAEMWAKAANLSAPPMGIIKRRLESEIEYKPLRQLRTELTGRLRVALSADQRRLVAAGAGGAVEVWEIGGKQVGAFSISKADITEVGFVRHSNFFWALDEEGMIHLWIITGEKEKPEVGVVSIGGDGSAFRSGVVISDKHLLLTGSDDGVARLWSLEKGKCVANLADHRSAVSAVTLGPKGPITATENGQICFWNRRGMQVDQIDASGAVRALMAQEDVVAWVEASGKVSMVRAGGHPMRLQGHHGQGRTLGFRKDGYFVSGGEDGRLLLYDGQSATPVQEIHVPAPVHRLVITDRVLVTICEGGSVFVFSRKASRSKKAKKRRSS